MTYYKDGCTLYEIGRYHGIGKYGHWKTFYDNGQLNVGRYYHFDYLNGPYEEYRKDGSLKESGVMGSDKQIGLWFKLKKSAFVVGVYIPTYVMYDEKNEDE